MVDFSNIWQRFKYYNDLSAKEVLVLNYLPLVHLITRRVASSLPSFVDREDLESAGTLGLLNAIERYDPDRGISFESYAKLRIHGMIIDELRAIDWMPRSLRRKVKKVGKAHDRLEHKLGRRVTDQDIAEELHIPVKDIHLLSAESEKAVQVSLEDCVVRDKNGKALCLLDKIEDNSTPNPVEKLEEEEMHVMIQNEIESLSKDERLIIILYYYERMTLKEIGYIMNLSESRISQIHSKILSKFRNSFDAREARDCNVNYRSSTVEKIGV